jgi:hypothetical protein
MARLATSSDQANGVHGEEPLNTPHTNTLCPELCPPRAKSLQFHTTGHTFSRSPEKRDVLVAHQFVRETGERLIKKRTEGGSAKPPPPVQIRAAPPFLLIDHRSL